MNIQVPEIGALQMSFRIQTSDILEKSLTVLITFSVIYEDCVSK
jgi:hypothetical protein